MKCFVYRNLSKPGHVYSLKALEGPHKGKIVGYASTMLITDATLKVSQAGRNRALREGQRNVHAGIVGNVKCAGDLISRLPNEISQKRHNRKDGVEITYNPWKYDSFVVKKTAKPIQQSQYVDVRFGVVKAG